MAQERVVKVVLTAQMQNYLAGMEKARKVTSEAATEAAKLANTKRQFDQLGRTAMAAGGLIAVGLGVAVARFAEFDQAMSNVQAATRESAENMALLRDAALDAGASTVFSATEAANAIEELGKAGVSTADILNGGLDASLDLAAAGGLEVADAAGIAAVALKTFNLEGADMSHVADLLAAGAGKAMGDVTDLSAALRQGGQVAAATGLSIEETTAALSAFASQGLLGSDAGTSFKAMLQRLTPQSAEAKRRMDELGISAYDAAGNFVGLEAFAGNLETSLKHLTVEQRNSALATIFGSDAVRAANVLYDEGAAGIASWTRKVDEQGYAADQAAIRLDNLRGDIEAFTGAVDTALISMGSAADGPLRGFVQMLTGLVDKFNEMPEGGKQAVFWVLATASAGSTALGAYLLLVPKMAEFNAALEVLGPRAQTASKWVGTLAKVGGGALVGVAAGAVALDYLTQALKAIGPSAEETANQVKTAADAIELLDAAIQKQGAGSKTRLAEAQIKSLGETLEAFSKGANGQGGIIAANTIANLSRLGGELEALAGSDLPAAQKQFRALAEAADLTTAQQKILLEQMPGFKDALTEQATAAGEATTASSLLDLAMGDSEASTKDNEDALRELAGQAVTTGDEVDGLADKIRDFGSATLNTRDANREFEQALDDLQESLTTNGATLDTTEQAGRDNQKALDDLATSTLEFAAATYEQTGSQEDANKVIQTGRDRLIDMLGQLGITGDAAEDYADDLGLIPSNVKTAVALTGVDAARWTLDQLTMPRIVRISVNGPTSVNPFIREGHATGGAITGPGSGTSDTAGLFPLSNGEHVLTASDVAAMGGQHAVYAFRDSLHNGGGQSAPSDGMTITGRLEIGGDGLARIIDGRIVSADRALARAITNGG